MARPYPAAPTAMTGASGPRTRLEPERAERQRRRSPGTKATGVGPRRPSPPSGGRPPSRGRRQSPPAATDRRADDRQKTTRYQGGVRLPERRRRMCADELLEVVDGGEEGDRRHCSGDADRGAEEHEPEHARARRRGLFAQRARSLTAQPPPRRGQPRLSRQGVGRPARVPRGLDIGARRACPTARRCRAGRRAGGPDVGPHVVTDHRDVAASQVAAGPRVRRSRDRLEKNAGVGLPTIGARVSAANSRPTTNEPQSRVGPSGVSHHGLRCMPTSFAPPRMRRNARLRLSKVASSGESPMTTAAAAAPGARPRRGSSSRWPANSCFASSEART